MNHASDFIAMSKDDYVRVCNRIMSPHAFLCKYATDIRNTTHNVMAMRQNSKKDKYDWHLDEENTITASISLTGGLSYRQKKDIIHVVSDNNTLVHANVADNSTLERKSYITTTPRHVIVVFFRRN